MYKRTNYSFLKSIFFQDAFSWCQEKFNIYFNPAREKYRWIDSGYLGISYQHKPSTIPSSLGNIFHSATSGIVGKELNNKENNK